MDPWDIDYENENHQQLNNTSLFPRMQSNDDDDESNDPFKQFGSGGSAPALGRGEAMEMSSGEELTMNGSSNMLMNLGGGSPSAGMSTDEPPSAVINPEIMESYESESHFADADLVGRRYAEDQQRAEAEAAADEAKRNKQQLMDMEMDNDGVPGHLMEFETEGKGELLAKVAQPSANADDDDEESSGTEELMEMVPPDAERKFVRVHAEPHQLEADSVFQQLDLEEGSQAAQNFGQKLEDSSNLLLTVDPEQLDNLDELLNPPPSPTPQPEGEEQSKKASRSQSRDLSQRPTSSKRSSATPAPPASSSASRKLSGSLDALARMVDSIAREDQRVLRLHGFGPMHIQCERLEVALQRDKKDTERRKIKADRDQRQKEMEERRRQKQAAREKRREERGGAGNSSDSGREETDGKRHKKKKPLKHGKPREEAQPLQRRTFPRIVQCCVCELIVNSARFGGKESAFCSPECIGKKVEQTKKCVKDNDPVVMIDLKGSLATHHGVTLGRLEAFLLDNPNYQPVINAANEEAAQRELDPAQQKKIDKIRMDCRKSIEQALQKRSKAANMNFSMKRYKDMGQDIEKALYSQHQEVDVKYRRWFRGFITVLNNERNGFFRDVMRDKVSVKKLVTMPPEQMNSPMPAGSTAAGPSSAAIIAAADSTSASEAPKAEEGGHGKAEAGIDSKVATTSRHSKVKPAPQQQQPGTSNVHTRCALDDIMGVMDKDTSYLHMSHLYDANCKICKSMSMQKMAEKERLEKLEARLEAKRKAEEAQAAKLGGIANLDPAIRAAMRQDNPDGHFFEEDLLAAERRRRQEEAKEEERRLRDPLGLVDIAPVPQPLPPDQVLAGRSRDDEEEDGDDAMDFDQCAEDFEDFQAQGEGEQLEPEGSIRSVSSAFDRQSAETGQQQRQLHQPVFLRPMSAFGAAHTPPRQGQEQQWQQSSSAHFGGQGENWKRRDVATAHGQQAQAVQPVIEEINPWETLSHRIWTGKFVWNKLLLFDCSLLAVSNRGAFKAGQELPKEILVLGKSEPKGVWTYVEQLKDSWNKQVILMVVEPPKVPPLLEPYHICYEKVNSNAKQEIIVLDLKGQEQIKDGYMFTLNPNEPLPRLLYPLEGPGLPEWCKRQGCIVLMLIRRMDREDKLWRKRADDETWRPRPLTLQPSAIPLEEMPMPPNDPLARVNRDPSFAASASAHPQQRAQPLEQEEQGGGSRGWRSPSRASNAIAPFPGPGALFAEISPIVCQQQQQQVRQEMAGTSAASSAALDWRRAGAVDSPPSVQRMSSPFNTPAFPPRRPSRCGTFDFDGGPIGPPMNSSTPFVGTKHEHGPIPMAPEPWGAEEQQMPSQFGPMDEMPCVETVEEVLEAIQRIDKPATLILFVGNFMSTHFVSAEDRAVISNAVRIRSEREKQKVGERQMMAQGGAGEEAAEFGTDVGFSAQQQQQFFPAQVPPKREPSPEANRFSPLSMSASRLEIAEESRANTPVESAMAQHSGTPEPFATGTFEEGTARSTTRPSSTTAEIGKIDVGKEEKPEEAVKSGENAGKEVGQEEEHMRPYSPSDHIHEEHLAHARLVPKSKEPQPVPPVIATPISTRLINLPMPPTVKPAVVAPAATALNVNVAKEKVTMTTPTKSDLSLRPPPPPPPPPPVPSSPRHSGSLASQSPPPPPPPEDEPSASLSAIVPPPPPPQTANISMPFTALMQLGASAMFQGLPVPPPPPPPPQGESAIATGTVLPPPPPPPKFSSAQQEQQQQANAGIGTIAGFSSAPPTPTGFPPQQRPFFTPLNMPGAGVPRQFFPMPPNQFQQRPMAPQPGPGMPPFPPNFGTPFPSNQLPGPSFQRPFLQQQQAQAVQHQQQQMAAYGNAPNLPQPPADYEETLASSSSAGFGQPQQHHGPPERVDPFYMSPGGGAVQTQRHGGGEMFAEDIELDNFTGYPGPPRPFPMDTGPAMHGRFPPPHHHHPPQMAPGFGPSFHSPGPRPLFSVRPGPHPPQQVTPRRGAPPRWRFGPPPPFFAQQFASGCPEISPGGRGAPNHGIDPIAEALRNAEMNASAGAGGGFNAQPDAFHGQMGGGQQLAQAALDVPRTPEQAQPAEQEEEGSSTAAGEDWGEIPAEFGLPTSFFSNKQLWQDKEQEQMQPAKKWGGGRGRGGGGGFGRRGGGGQQRF